MTNRSMENTLFQSPTKTVYYHSLVRWNVVDEITFLTDAEEHVHVREYILKSLDVVVMETVLHHLPREKHEVFLEKVVNEYHDESLLDWIEEQVIDIREHLSATIRKTKAEIKELLLQI